MSQVGIKSNTTKENRYNCVVMALNCVLLGLMRGKKKIA